jgi:GTP-binding protein Era
LPPARNNLSVNDEDAAMKSGTVVLVGRPNSGKSTLLNALVGEKISIVSDKPQTTRYRILGILNEGRGQAVFVDTPGIHKPQYRMNERMQHITQESMHNVDLVLLMIDGSIASGAGERFTLEMLKSLKPRAMLLINKIDRIAKPRILPIMERYSAGYDFLEIIPISALESDNLRLVVDKVFEYLPEGEMSFDPEQITDRTERFLAAEFIREKILERTRDELVYATAVLIRSFDESKRESSKLVRVEADILVEKRSHQGIILGARGTRLRDIGIAARQQLEQLLGCRVYLALHVRTVDKWRNSESVLNELEFGK